MRSDPGCRCAAALRRRTQDHSALSVPEVSSLWRLSLLCGDPRSPVRSERVTGWAVLTSILVCAGTRSLRWGWGHGSFRNGFPVQVLLSSLWSGFLFSLWFPIFSSLLWSDSSLVLSALLSLCSYLLCSTHTIDWLVNLARREPECLLGESAKVRRHSGSRRGGAAGGGALREECRRHSSELFCLVGLAFPDAGVESERRGPVV